LATSAVDAVEGKGFIHGLLLPLDLNCHALLVELVLGNTQVHSCQQELIVSDKPAVKCHLAILQAYLTLLQEQPQINTDHGRLLHFSSLIDVVLQDDL
jgi:hypothetical protein